MFQVLRFENSSAYFFLWILMVTKKNKRPSKRFQWIPVYFCIFTRWSLHFCISKFRGYPERLSHNFRSMYYVLTFLSEAWPKTPEKQPKQPIFIFATTYYWCASSRHEFRSQSFVTHRKYFWKVSLGNWTRDTPLRSQTLQNSHRTPWSICKKCKVSVAVCPDWRLPFQAGSFRIQKDFLPSKILWAQFMSFLLAGEYMKNERKVARNSKKQLKKLPKFDET